MPGSRTRTFFAPLGPILMTPDLVVLGRGPRSGITPHPGDGQCARGELTDELAGDIDP